jgi:hypothetical protein
MCFDAKQPYLIGWCDELAARALEKGNANAIVVVFSQKKFKNYSHNCSVAHNSCCM